MSARLARLVLVTGLSGAGRSSSLKILEDMGYEAVDNLPLALLAALAELPPRADAGVPGLAVGIDTRTRDFHAEAVLGVLAQLRGHPELDVKLLFLDCDDEVLQHRFTATRRRHPLAGERPVADGIRHERTLTFPMRNAADLVIDTSRLSLPELRRLIAGHFAPATGPGLAVAVTSFSYRLGLPREADLVFDVRFLRNPHYEEHLRPHSGENPDVAAFIMQDPAFAPFQTRLSEMVLSLIPSFRREGKTYLTIAIGCTGGRHRSVHVARELARALEDDGQKVTLLHRDIARGEP
ncbi:MAG: RNase adapter RapZ [Alphaproteobacteria bacterium]|nr:RNase adapter RapZ [Alphaproteobacteria bacterium]